MNKGIKIANGDIIGFLHSDDMFASPGTLQNIADAFSSRLEDTGGNPDVMYGDLVFVDKQNTNKVARYWKSQPFKPRLLQRGWMPAHPTVFMRHGVYEKSLKYELGKASFQVHQQKPINVYYESKLAGEYFSVLKNERKSA